MAVIITTVDDDGNARALDDLVEEVLEADPDAETHRVKGGISGIRVSDRSAVLWLMQRYTTKGNRRADGGGSNG